jgi:hypothetical protein
MTSSLSSSERFFVSFVLPKKMPTRFVQPASAVSGSRIREPDSVVDDFIGARAQLPRRGVPAFAGCA